MRLCVFYPCVYVCVYVCVSRHTTLLAHTHTRTCNHYYFVIVIIFLTLSTFKVDLIGPVRSHEYLFPKASEKSLRAIFHGGFVLHFCIPVDSDVFRPN